MSKRTQKDFQDISWFDLESWAGSRIVSRGKSYQRSKHVRDLAITESGEIIAWVKGSTTYATKVSLDKDGLSSACTCPYSHACKHAVAVILEYLDCIKNGRNVLNAGKDDERLSLVEGKSEYYENDDDLYDDGSEDNDDIIARQSKASTIPGLDDYLGEKSKEDMLSLMNVIITRRPEIREELDYKVRIERGKPSALVKTVEREIVKASSEPGWRNYWKHTGYTPDYSRVRAGIQKLLDEGHADEVFRLGEKLFSTGITQIEQSHDEGETAQEIADSLTIVFKALGECSLNSVDKMEMAVDFRLRDEYDLCYGLEVFWKQRFIKKDWGSLADRLLSRMGDTKHEKQEDSFSRNYHRDRLTDEIIGALENAGRHNEVLSLCMQEAEKSGSYERLVKKLRKAGLTEEAEEWIYKGIMATCNKWPGIAGMLKKELLDIRRLKKDWLFVAALHADEFLDRPSLSAFEELRKASEKAKVWFPVREAILNFLETGKNPAKNSSDWSLPDTGIEKPDKLHVEKSPRTDVLIEIAIHEKRIDDVLKWFDIHKKRQKYGGGEGLKDDVATAVAGEYPDKAIWIWKELAETQFAITNVAAYSVGAGYLRKAQKILEQNGRVNEWDAYLQGLKETNRRKPRLIEILNALSEKPIIRGIH
ncbi:MAG: SWIM zinc finger domain-containing protein [Nitrospirae bacterium]|nr:SWIM zinc finger domain-containing protein [Nitrospirota bacterium]